MTLWDINSCQHVHKYRHLLAQAELSDKEKHNNSGDNTKLVESVWPKVVIDLMSIVDEVQ